MENIIIAFVFVIIACIVGVLITKLILSIAHSYSDEPNYISKQSNNDGTITNVQSVGSGKNKMQLNIKQSNNKKSVINHYQGDNIEVLQIVENGKKKNKVIIDGQIIIDQTDEE